MVALPWQASTPVINCLETIDDAVFRASGTFVELGGATGKTASAACGQRGGKPRERPAFPADLVLEFAGFHIFQHVSSAKMS
jgi:hypothetical protein